MAKIQLAALKRARMKQEDRKELLSYVMSFRILPLPLLLKSFLKIGNIDLTQYWLIKLPNKLKIISLVNVTLANTGTVICFRTEILKSRDDMATI
jgi:hypothetical protein